MFDHLTHPIAQPPDGYGLHILFALQSRPQYAGTVPEHEVARRRRRNRAARAARRLNRGQR